MKAVSSAPAALLLCALLPGAAASARAEKLPIKVYTTVDGLASDRINCILRDSRGFLWFGTWDGIARFDGDRFENVSRGLPGPSVSALLEARDGTYWAATVGGLARWDPAREGAIAGVRTLPLSPGRAEPGLHALLEDRDGALWIGGESGLFRAADRRAGKWSPEVVVVDAARKPVYALLEDRAGGLWIGGESGLYRREPGGGLSRIAAANGSPSDVRCLMQDREGTLWIGTHANGIFQARSESRTGSWTVQPFSSLATGLAGNHVFSLFQASDGTVWAGCYGGLSQFSPGAPEPGRPRSYSSAEGLPALGIFAVAEDQAENLWIGTDDAGVARITSGGFLTYREEDGLIGPRIVSLFRNRAGEVCASSAGTRSEVLSDTGRILECFDGRRFHAVKPRLPAATHLGWGWAQVSFQDTRGEWWIPTFEGLFRFPAVPFPRLASTPPRVYTTAQGLPSNEIFRLFEDRSGDVWMSFSSSDRRLARWIRSAEKIQVFSPADGLPVDVAISLAADPTGAVWAGFYEGGVARILHGRLDLLDARSGIPVGRIRALHVDRAGRLWIGSSRGGVGRVDHPDRWPPQVRSYTTRDHLSSDNIWSFTEDRWGRIYIGTEHGLDRLDPTTGFVQTFTTDDGLVGGVIEESLEDDRGDLWFGSVQGLSRLVPLPPRRRNPPPIRIARVLVGGIRHALPSLGSVHLRLPDLRPRAGPIQIDYFGVDFAAGGRPRYQYRLDGADAQWSPPLEERSVIYANLRPGRYRFRVRAIRNDGTASPEPAEVAFTVLPPYWQRSGFLLAGAAAILAAAYGLHRYRLRGALALERVRTRIATDLHDDVGSSLSQIAILAEIARQQPDDAMPKARQILARIAGVSRSVVDSLGDTIWAIDPQKDRLLDLVHRMRRFAGDLLAERQIELAFTAATGDADRDLASDARRELYLIFKEAVHNVARHSGCTRVEIDFRVRGQELALMVSDDGKGLGAAGGSDGYGLASIRSRAAGLRGAVEIFSRADREPGASGTTLLLTVPLPK